MNTNEELGIAVLKHLQLVVISVD